MIKIKNLEHEESKSMEEVQSFAAMQYDNQNKQIKKTLNVELKDDMETCRKVWKITADMITEDSCVYDVIFSDKITDKEKDEIVHSALRLHNKKRKEIVKITTGKTGLDKDQEVALCGAFFRYAVASPLLLALDGKGL